MMIIELDPVVLALGVALIFETIGFTIIAPRFTRRAMRAELRRGEWDNDVASMMLRVVGKGVGHVLQRFGGNHP